MIWSFLLNILFLTKDIEGRAWLRYMLRPCATFYLATDPKNILLAYNTSPKV